jgi:tight adherence protein C
MILTLIAGIFLAGVAVVLVLRAMALQRIETGERLGDIEAYGFAETPAREREGSLRNAAAALAARIGGRVVERAGRKQQDEIARLLLAGGMYDMTPVAFAGYRVLGGILAAVGWLWIAPSVGVTGALAVVVLPLAAVGGWMLPLRLLRDRAGRRLDRMDRALPELIDLLVVTVEAGLGLTAAMQLAGQRIEGPLGEELRLALREQSMGLPLNSALTNLLERCDSPSTRIFVRSIVQAESLGVSIGEILRGLAGDMRMRRRQDAEERAQKAPIKMLFPLVFFIFPSMFIVLLTPAVIRLVDSLGNL